MYHVNMENYPCIWVIINVYVQKQNYMNVCWKWKLESSNQIDTLKKNWWNALNYYYYHLVVIRKTYTSFTKLTKLIHWPSSKKTIYFIHIHHLSSEDWLDQLVHLHQQTNDMDPSFRYSRVFSPLLFSQHISLLWLLPNLDRSNRLWN